MISCRTIPRSTEFVYAGLVVMVFALGMALVVLGASYGPWPTAIAAIGFLAIGAQHYRRVLVTTASELFLDPATETLHWRATRGQGVISISEIEEVTRSRHPGVYEIRCRGGGVVAFWLGTRRRTARPFFRRLESLNPSMHADQRYEKRWSGWAGLRED